MSQDWIKNYLDLSEKKWVDKFHDSKMLLSNSATSPLHPAGDKILTLLLEDGDFQHILRSPIALQLFQLNTSNDQRTNETSLDYSQHLSRQIDLLLHQDAEDIGEKKKIIHLIALASLHAFLQSNVTGPPLDWSPKDICIPSHYRSGDGDIQAGLINLLTVDGEAIYRLTPHVELFIIAKTVLNHPLLLKEDVSFIWSRLRVNFWHQRMLDESAPSLQDSIYKDLAHLDGAVLEEESSLDAHIRVLFLLERAAIHTFHGFDKKARDDLEAASKKRGFEHVLTGRLGKRTKFQQKDLSQLVVLAKSTEDVEDNATNAVEGSNRPTTTEALPEKLDLNDDTLLESIAFTKPSTDSTHKDEENIPPALARLDPSKQPVLHPLDSIILLSFASSITNNSPVDGLTREETLPYATRLLDSGSTNWQVYTQALLVRSRIEGYRSRTVERGVLQLQALVDQVIAETTGNQPNPTTDGNEPATTTFLPRAKESESASVSERLLYIHQLASSPRWTLEAELASRWVSLGGLRTALEIFERLHMWAEAALCYAATDREEHARKIVHNQLYSTPALESNQLCRQEDLTERNPLPPDAPRLLCILGDIDQSPALYERAWEVSKKRYARAQRSLGKHYVSIQDLESADKAYSLAVHISPQDSGTWFALGCVCLETQKWSKAIDAFTRTVQIVPDDAEAWSNLAATLLRLPPSESPSLPFSHLDDDPSLSTDNSDPQRHKHQAFAALKRAAAIKRESFKIWQNVLNVAVTLSPPPYSDIIIAQRQLISLKRFESSIDLEILEGLLSHVIQTSTPAQDGSGREHERGLPAMFANLIEEDVIPLITSSRPLWKLVARFKIWENRPGEALDAYEKAWRVQLNKVGWDDGTGVAASSATTTKDSEPETPEQVWKGVVEATVELVDAYESLGEREKESKRPVKRGHDGTREEGGMSSIAEVLEEVSDKGDSTAKEKELVCANWKYKARMAIRSVVGRRKKAGFDDVNELTERMEGLKSG